MTPNPRVVLYLSPTGQMGGAEHSLLDLVSHLDRARFHPHVVSLAEGPLLPAVRLRGAGAEVLQTRDAFMRTSLRGLRSSTVGLLAGVLRAGPAVGGLRRACRRAGASILHSNGNKAHLISLGARPASGVRIVWHVRDFLPDRTPERLLVMLANRCVAAVIANSGAVGARLRHLGVRPARLHVIPNGVDPATFTPAGPPAPLRAQFGWPAEAPVVGIVGVLARWKGQHVFLAAAREIAARRPDVRFVVVGDEIYRTGGHGTYAAELRALVERWRLTGIVGFTGYRCDVPDVLRALDVVVHASVEPEPFGRVIVEGLACGRPVVCTRGGGADEVVGGSPLAATQVPRADAAALAGAVEALLASPARRRALGSAGRTLVVDRYRLADHVARVEALYESLGEAR